MGTSTFEEAHAALKAIAAGRYFGLTVESGEHRDGELSVEWRGYISDFGSTDMHPTAGAMLEQMARIVAGSDERKAPGKLADVGTPPQSRASFGDYVEIERRKSAILSLVSALPAESPQ